MREVTADALRNDLRDNLSLSEENLLLVAIMAGGDYNNVSQFTPSNGLLTRTHLTRVFPTAA